MMKTAAISCSTAMLVVTCAVHAAGTENIHDELREEIARLTQRILKLERHAHEKEICAARHVELRSLVMDILADAEQRSVLREHAMLAGHDGRFFIAGADGNFRLAVGGQIHARAVYNRQSNSPTDNHRNGFELRRTQIKFEGHVVDSRLTYKVQGGFNRSGGEFILLDAEIGWAISNDWSLRAGQFRPGFLREDSTSSTRQLAVERSLVNARFGQNRMTGMDVRGRVGDQWRVSGMVSDGLRSRNTPWDRRTVEFALTGRVEWLVAGSWRQFRQFTSPPDDDIGMMLGAAIHWQRDEFGEPGVVRSPDILRWTVDGKLSLGGASAFAAFIASHEDLREGGNWLRWGLVVQAAVRFTNEWEAFARYEHGDLDEADAAQLSVITVGVNWYISEHRLKWTSDVGVGLNAVDVGWAAGSAGWRADSLGNSGQVVIRSQLQLLF